MTLFLTNAQFILLQVILKQKTQTISPKNADAYNNRSITKAKVRALKSTWKDGKKPEGLRNKYAVECGKNQWQSTLL